METPSHRMRNAIQAFLRTDKAPAAAFHETITSSWLQAIRHLMERAGRSASIKAFLANDDRLLDAAIMFLHDRKETLFPDKARTEFVLPDLQLIPQYR